MYEDEKNKTAVVLLSGGLDSTTTLACAISQGYSCYAISFSYGQRHEYELRYAGKVAEFFNLGSRHLVINLDPNLFSGSALTSDIEVPKNRRLDEMSRSIPDTYVPARNTVFLSLALSFAEQKHCTNIFIGANAVDYSGYPDCRPEFIEAFEKMANLGTKIGMQGRKIKIHAPLIDMSKSEIIKLGFRLGVDYSITWSCYNPNPDHTFCGICDSCIIRKKAFEETGMRDPADKGQ